MQPAVKKHFNGTQHHHSLLMDVSSDVMTVLVEYVPEEFMRIICKRWKQLIKQARKVHLRQSKLRLSELLQWPIEEFNALLNNPDVVIAGSAVMYAMNRYIERDSVNDVNIWFLNRSVQSYKNTILYFKEQKYYKETVRMLDSGYKRKKMFAIRYKRLAPYDTPHNTAKPVTLILTNIFDKIELISLFEFDVNRCCYNNKQFHAHTEALFAFKEQSVRIPREKFTRFNTFASPIEIVKVYESRILQESNDRLTLYEQPIPLEHRTTFYRTIEYLANLKKKQFKLCIC